MKKFFFESSLPRSGSNLISSILHQNPDIWTSPISPVFESICEVGNYLENPDKFYLYRDDVAIDNIISGVIKNYYEHISRPFIIDRSRTWSANVPLIKRYITDNPKIIVMVREPLDILASYIRKIRQNQNEISFIDRELLGKDLNCDDWNRSCNLMNEGGLIFESLKVFSEGFRKYRENLIIVDYNSFVLDPVYQMRRIYNFLELPYYEHDFFNIENTFDEDSELLGLGNLHSLNPQIISSETDYKEILSQKIINEWGSLNFWKGK
jgi:sulfotransferase